MEKNKKIVSAIIAVLFALTGGYAVSDSWATSSIGVAEQKVMIELERVIDGDTIVYNEDGESKKMRLLLIDTPESTVAKTGATQPFGKESKEFLTAYLVGKNLSLEYEETKEQEDQYGRILAYLFADGELVQKKLVREGLARVGYEEGQEIYLSDLKEAEQAAMLEKKNIWSIKNYVGEYGFNNK